jgi:hypothetical protein
MVEFTGIPKARWRRFLPFLILPVAVSTVSLTGCKAGYGADVSEQRELIALSKTLPPGKESDGIAFISTGLDNRTRGSVELVKLFVTNRDWTEFLPQKELDAWRKNRQYASPPVIIHEKQGDAAFHLMQLGPRARDAAPAIIQSLTNSELLTRQWATRQKNIEESQVQRADSMNRHWAIKILEAIGSASPEVVPALVGELHKSEYETGYKAAQALSIISLTDSNVLPAIIARLESDAELPAVKNSLRVLNGIGADARSAVPVLSRLLDTSDTFDLALSTLCAIGPDAAPAVPALVARYDQWRTDGSKFPQRKWIVITLGKIGPAAKEAIPTLEGLRNHTYESFDAIRALWRIDPRFEPLAINAARQALQAGASPNRTEAIALLGEIGPPAHAEVPLLLQVLDAPPNDAVAFNAAWALWRIDPDQKPKVISVMETISKQKARYPYTDLPLDAAGALWQIEPTQRNVLRPIILTMLKDWKETPGARIGWAEMKTLQPALEEIAHDPEYAELRPWAILAIRQINRARAEWWAR